MPHTETETHNGYTITYVNDECTESPRHDCQNGLIVVDASMTGRYDPPDDETLPDSFTCPTCDGAGRDETADIEPTDDRPIGTNAPDCPTCSGEGVIPATFARLVEWAKREHGATVVLGLDGPNDYTDRWRVWPYADDSTNVRGLIFDTAKRVAETGSPLDRMEEFLRAELDEYNAWAEGDVWSYEIRDRNGDRVDEAGREDYSNRIIGKDNAESEARGEADLAGPQPEPLHAVRLTMEQWQTVMVELPEIGLSDVIAAQLAES